MQPALAHEKIISTTLGETPTALTIYDSGKPGFTYFHPHADEVTSLAATQSFIHHHGGKIISLRHDKTPLISFNLAGQTYQVDPNRMFTTRGIKHSLQQHGHYSKAALLAVEQYANFVIQHLETNKKTLSSPLIISVHNNFNEGYSLRNYKNGGDLAVDAKAIHTNHHMSTGDFFFVTHQAIFDFIKSNNNNVVLQNNRTVTDDGSLSVYSAKHGIPYINVEAERGHFHRQKEMLGLLQRISTAV